MWVLTVLVLSGVVLLNETSAAKQERNSVEKFTITENVHAITRHFWNMVSSGEYIIANINLDLHFSRYDPRAPGFLRLFEEDFTGGDLSWIIDFVLFGIPLAHARAYYHIFDLNFEIFIQPRLTIEDMDQLIIICEKHAGITDGIGLIGEEEFVNGLEEVIFRGLPESLLFIRYHMLDILFYTEYVDWHSFLDIFQDIDSDDDDNVTKAEFSTFWHEGEYGTESDGEEFFEVLATGLAGGSVLRENHWRDLFEDLDCRDILGVDTLDNQEFLQLDLIRNGLRTVPSSECVLQRLPD